jgi:predicted branched-subunit amino acid permease
MTEESANCMTPVPTPRRECLAGARDILPLALGVAVYGLAFGVLAAQAHLAVPQVGAMGALVYAGSSQIMAVERLSAGAGVVAAVLAAAALNLRILLMTASLRRELHGRPVWQVVLGVHMTADENWALMQARQAAGQGVGYWYLVGAGLVQLTTWLCSTMLGAWSAGAIPEPRALGLDFAFTAAFIAILRTMWAGRQSLGPWAVAAGTVAGLSLFSPGASWTMIAGGLAGAVWAGMRADV